ncbi:MAG: serine hydrolase [Chloroflexi bacterium]|nr:serine hydrolase [Chloroflexota bacterium]
MTLTSLSRDLDSLVRDEMARRRIPGGALGVVHGDEELTLCFGVTNVDHPLPVTPDTLFQIGSTTKTMTATLLMQHVAAGRLDLDAPLRTYLDFTLANDDWAARLTPRHLLTHTGGLAGDHFLMHAVGERGDRALARLVELLPNVPHQAPPGEIFAYSNAGFAVLGRLVEVLGNGAPFDGLLARELLVPLGMTHAFELPEDVISERVAVGHRIEHGAPMVARPWALERAAMAHGGVISDLRNQLAYLRFQLGDGRAADGTRVLPAAAMRDMQREHVRAGSICDAFGLSWQLNDVGDQRVISHGGETNAQLSEIVLVPPERFGFTVLTNGASGGALARVLTAWLLERVLDARAEPVAVREIAKERLREYAGQYPGVLKDVALRVADGTLMLHVAPHTRPGRVPGAAPPPVRLGQITDDQIATIEEPALVRRGEFIRDHSGTIRWLRWDGRLHARSD